jgi:hypothetical protein
MVYQPFEKGSHTANVQFSAHLLRKNPPPVEPVCPRFAV